MNKKKLSSSKKCPMPLVERQKRMAISALTKPYEARTQGWQSVGKNGTAE